MMNETFRMTKEIQLGKKIILDSFVYEDFGLPVLRIDARVSGDYLPPALFSRQQSGHAVLAEWEGVCFRKHCLHVYEED